jgi:hypothetical protein
MSWHYSRALVEAYSAATCLDGTVCAPSNGNPTPQAYLSPDRTKAFSRLSRFGMTSEPLTEPLGAALLTWYREGFRARTSAAPEREQASKASGPACGKKWRGSLAKYDPDTCSWRTAQFSLLGGLELFSETFPRWGTMRNGECSERTTPVLRIEGRGSGYWPTPKASRDGVSPKTIEMVRNGLAEMSLARIMYMPEKWPANTPSGNWPTPTCADAYTDKLQSSQQKEGSMHSVNLSQAVKMWPTPCASDDRDRGNMANPAIKRRVEMGKQVMLSMAVKEDVGGGQLNPDWVEWLMNWPVSWSSLTPLSHEHFNEWLARTKAGATRIQADILPRMRNQGQPAQTPQGPGQAEQHAGEHCDTVPSMPREGTREEGRLGEGKCSASPLSDMRSSVQIEQDAKRQGVQRFLQGGNGQAVGSEAMGWTEQGEAMHELRKDIHIHTTASKDMQPVVREHSGPPEPWWSAEPVGVPRVATGIAKRADRLKCIGNGQVPAVVRLAWHTLHERIQSRLNP